MLGEASPWSRASPIAPTRASCTTCASAWTGSGAAAASWSSRVRTAAAMAAWRSGGAPAVAPRHAGPAQHQPADQGERSRRWGARRAQPGRSPAASRAAGRRASSGDRAQGIVQHRHRVARGRRATAWCETRAAALRPRPWRRPSPRRRRGTGPRRRRRAGGSEWKARPGRGSRVRPAIAPRRPSFRRERSALRRSTITKLTIHSPRASGTHRTTTRRDSAVSPAARSTWGTRPISRCAEKCPPTSPVAGLLAHPLAEQCPRRRRIRGASRRTAGHGDRPVLGRSATTSRPAARTAAGPRPASIGGGRRTRPGGLEYLDVAAGGKVENVAGTASAVTSPACTSRLTTAGDSRPRSIVAGPAGQVPPAASAARSAANQSHQVTTAATSSTRPRPPAGRGATSARPARTRPDPTRSVADDPLLLAANQAATLAIDGGRALGTHAHARRGGQLDPRGARPCPGRMRATRPCARLAHSCPQAAVGRPGHRRDARRSGRVAVVDEAHRRQLELADALAPLNRREDASKRA